MTPLIFARYAAENRRFSDEPHAAPEARAIGADLARLFGADAARRGAFMARLGAGAPAQARSLRLPLEKLLIARPPEKKKPA
jgi:hypothetical protein